jgi:hypothetical protein
VVEAERGGGAVDVMLIGYPGERPLPGAVRAELRSLAGPGGAIRVLDAMFVAKAQDGTFSGHEARDLVGDLIDGDAAAGLLGGEDAAAAAAVMDPGQAGLLLMYQPRWAGGLARAAREGGGRLMDMGGIRVGDVLAAMRRPAPGDPSAGGAV